MKQANLQLTQELTNRSQNNGSKTNFNPYYITDSYKPDNVPLPPVDLRNSFAIDVNPVKKKPCSIDRIHFTQLLLTFYLYCGIFFTLYLLLSQNEQGRHYTAIIIICSLIYLSYIGMTVQRSEERVYLQNLLGGQHFEIQYENNRSKKGMFNMVAQCYHIVKRQIIKPAKNKHSKRQVQTIQQKIITYTANQSFSPKTINDLSGSADRIRASTNIIFVQFKVNYNFKDQASRQIFFKEFDRFKSKNKRDVHQRYEYNYEVNNFKHKLSFYAGTLPCNLKIWYNIFLLTGLLWPFCIWLQFKIQRCQINFVHQIKL